MNKALYITLIGIGFANIASGTPVTYQFNNTVNATYSISANDFVMTVTPGTNVLTVVLSNFHNTTVGDTQQISGVTFTLGMSNSNAPTLGGASGQLITVSSGGAWVYGSSTHPAIDHWRTQNLGVLAGVTTVNLDVFTGGSPYDLVIGNSNSTNNLYDTANNSVIAHQPSILNTATFTINMAGVTSSTVVTGTTFNVGTTTPQTVDAIFVAPEPQTYQLVLLAVPFGLYLRRKKVGRRFRLAYSN